MAKSGALDLATGVGGKIEKNEVLSAVEKYSFSVEDVSFMWAACVSKVPSIAAKEVRRKKLMSGTHQFKDKYELPNKFKPDLGKFTQQRQLLQSKVFTGISRAYFSSMSLSLGTKSTTSGQSNLDSLGSALNHPRKFTTYAERMSTNLAFSDGTSLSVGSPKTKKTRAETREELAE
ncbi:unnamed protein product [Camellia sinensis]